MYEKFGISTDKIWSKFCSWIYHLQPRKKVSLSCENTIGYQYKNSFSSDAVVKNSFDTALFTYSTMGRLEFSINWKNILLFPNFWNNKALSRIYGFTYPEYSDPYSKISIFINKIWIEIANSNWIILPHYSQ